MHQSKRRMLLISIILLLLVGVVFSCCSCAVQVYANSVEKTQREAVNKYVCDVCYTSLDDCTDVLFDVLSDCETNDNTLDVINGYSSFLDSTFSGSVVTRGEWLKALMDTLSVDVDSGNTEKFDYFVDKDYFSSNDYFITAVRNGILGPGGDRFGSYSAATRQYVSTTLVNAVGYPKIYKLNCADYNIVEDKAHVGVAVQLGYFELDENNCFNPYDLVTQEQVDFIVAELLKLNELEGKTILSFGDSIMHGDGNNFDGIADLMAQRYMMTAIDYSKGGSTFGKVANREQISNQILTAIKKHETADIIFINGGTNDMRKVAPGVISDDFRYGKHGREDFASGMEYALGLLKDNYPDIPVLYVRAHDMEYGIERNELHFGNLALHICEKWDVSVADIFSESEFNAHDEQIKSVYTVHTKLFKNGDSIHPNRVGYQKFYLPLVSEKTIEILTNNN